MANGEEKDPIEAASNALGRDLIEKGVIVAAGFDGYKLLFHGPRRWLPEWEASERRAFFAGAHHLFSAIMNSALDGGTQETDGDLRRMDAIARELKEFEQTVLLPAAEAAKVPK